MLPVSIQRILPAYLTLSSPGPGVKRIGVGVLIAGREGDRSECHFRDESYFRDGMLDFPEVTFSRESKLNAGRLKLTGALYGTHPSPGSG